MPEALEVAWVFGAGVLRERLARRVSWTPGAEGAPSDGVVDVGCEAAGVMRRAWEEGGRLVGEPVGECVDLHTILTVFVVCSSSLVQGVIVTRPDAGGREIQGVVLVRC